MGRQPTDMKEMTVNHTKTLKYALLAYAAIATLAGPLPTRASDVGQSYMAGYDPLSSFLAPGAPRYSTLPLAVRENPPWPPRRPTDLGVTPTQSAAN
jgi:hypothetical protein